MALPAVSASLDKSTYAPGATMTLTVNYGDPADASSGTVTVVVTDSQGNVSAPATVNYNTADPTTVAVSDSNGRTFAKVSDTGSVAVYTTTA